MVAPLFADELPYAYMVGEHVVLLHNPPAHMSLTDSGSWGLGTTWSVVQRNIDTMSDPLCLELSDRIAGLFRLVPVGGTLQVRHDIYPRNVIPEWSAPRALLPDPSIRWQNESVAQGMRHAAGTGSARLVSMDTIISFRIPIAAPGASLRKMSMQILRAWQPDYVVHDRRAAIQKAVEEEAAEFESIALAFDQQLALLGFRPTRLDGQGFLQALTRCLDPFCEKIPDYVESTPLRDQTPTEEPTMAADSYAIGDCRAKVYSLRRALPQTYPGILSADRHPDNLSHALNLATLAPDYPLSIAVNTLVENQQTITNRIGRKGTWAFRHRADTRGQRYVANEQTEDSIISMQERMTGGQEQVLTTSVHVVSWGPRHGTRMMDSGVLQSGNHVGISWIPEKYHGNGLFLQALPLGCNPTFPAKEAVARMLLVPAKHVADELPLWGSLQSPPDSHACLFLNRQGKPFLWDQFNSNVVTSPHVLVVGQIRSGKSTLGAHLANQVLPLGAAMIIVDRYGSYNALCRHFGGTITTIDLDHPPSLNPFDCEFTPSNIAFLSQLLPELASGGDERSQLYQEQVVQLETLLHYYADHRDTSRIACMNDFVKTLRAHPYASMAQFSDFMATLLSPYCYDEVTNIHGRFEPIFNGKNALTMTRGMTVIDIQGLENAKSLQGAVMMIIIKRARDFSHAEENLLFPKYLYIDECSFLMRHQTSATFMRDMTVAEARFRFGMIFLSQQMTDFMTDLGGVLIRNAGTMFFFKLNAVEFNTIKEPFNLGEQYASLVQSLDRYTTCSEALFHTPGNDHMSGVVRLVPDPHFLIRIAQDFKVVSARARALADNDQDLEKAIEAMIARPEDYFLEGVL